MQFDYNLFIDALEREGLTRQQTAMRIYEEVRQAENQKAGFLDQASENPDFYRMISVEIDKYITQLKLLHNSLSRTPQELDQ